MFEFEKAAGLVGEGGGPYLPTRTSQSRCSIAPYPLATITSPASYPPPLIPVSLRNLGNVISTAPGAPTPTLFPLPLLQEMQFEEHAFENIDSLAHATYIQQLVRADPTNVEVILTCPDEDDEPIWQYDHFRCG